jgi:hypothetical protein
MERSRKLECPAGIELSATIVKIARATSDGIWTLTQTITQDKTTPSVRIAMAVKNNALATGKTYSVRFMQMGMSAIGYQRI